MFFCKIWKLQKYADIVTPDIQAHNFLEVDTNCLDRIRSIIRPFRPIIMWQIFRKHEVVNLNLQRTTKQQNLSCLIFFLLFLKVVKCLYNNIIIYLYLPFPALPCPFPLPPPPFGENTQNFCLRQSKMKSQDSTKSCTQFYVVFLFCFLFFR